MTKFRDQQRKRLLYWLATISYIILIYLCLPITFDLVKWINARASLGKIVNSSIVLILTTFAFAVSLKLLKAKRIKILTGLLSCSFLLMIGLMNIKLPVERIHILEYGFLAVLACGAFQFDFSKRKSAVASLCFAALVGLFDEVIQYYLPNRFFEMRDVMLNVAGAVLGLVFYGIYQGTVQIKFWRNSFTEQVESKSQAPSLPKIVKPSGNFDLSPLPQRTSEMKNKL